MAGSWASLVAIVGLAHEFPCAGLAHCFQFFSDALLVAACGAFVGIIMFFTSVCAAAAWPSALVNLKMIGYVSFAAAGIAASLVLYRVFVCVSAAAARPSALFSVEPTDFAFPARGLGVILKTGGSGACLLCKCLHCQLFLIVLGCSSQSCCRVWSSSSSMRVGCILPVGSWFWVHCSWFLLLGSSSFHRVSRCHHALEVLLFLFMFSHRMEDRKAFEAG